MKEINEKRQMIEQLSDLPTLPTIMLKIFSCIDDPLSSADDLKNIIINDVAVSAKVLKLANSAYFGYSREITDITAAIVVLGFDMVIDIAVSVSLASILTPKEDLPALTMEQFWEHNIAAGQAGRIIAKACNYPHTEQAFLIGLMHDIGKVIFISKFTREYQNAIEYSNDFDKFIWEGEEYIFGFHHGEAGAWLANYWKFPAQLITPIRYHNHPEKVKNGHRKEVLIAFLADYLAKMSGIGISGDNNKIPVLHKDVFKYLIKTENDVEAMNEELLQQRDFIKTFVGVVL